MVNFESFLNWAEDRFGNVLVHGKEIKINSIFCDDNKFHLWCSPSGGKNEVKYGVYHCWKTDKHGTLVDLIMQVDKCSFKEAWRICGGQLRMSEVEKKLLDIFKQKKEEIKITKGLKLPEKTFKIKELPLDSNIRIRAEKYLQERKLPTDMLVCTGGKCYNRIVIPYYNKNNELIYWNCRTLNPDEALRYKGPEKELGVYKENVMFFTEWPKTGEKVYITEGEFDAISIKICGLNSAAFGGKNLSEKQIEILSEFIPVLCLDNDKIGVSSHGTTSAGQIALKKIGDTLLQHGFNEFYYVRPPIGYKDWNALLIDNEPDKIKDYILKNENKYTDQTSILLLSNEI